MLVENSTIHIMSAPPWTGISNMIGELLLHDTQSHGTNPKELSNVVPQTVIKNLLKTQYDEYSYTLKILLREPKYAL